jgi:hypothetical protein
MLKNNENFRAYIFNFGNFFSYLLDLSEWFNFFPLVLINWFNGNGQQ